MEKNLACHDHHFDMLCIALVVWWRILLSVLLNLTSRRYILFISNPIFILAFSTIIWNIIREFRKRGKIKTGLTWQKFLEMHKKYFYAMDLFTMDTALNKRFYVLFFISQQTKEIDRFAVTENPVKEFVRQLIVLSEERNGSLVQWEEKISIVTLSSVDGNWKRH